jgi:hypothetical protein
VCIVADLDLLANVVDSITFFWRVFACFLCVSLPRVLEAQKLRQRRCKVLFLKDFFCAFCRFSKKPPAFCSLFVAKQAFFWSAVCGVQHVLGVLHIPFIVAKYGCELFRGDAIADHIVFYLAQKGITKTMYGLAYESIAVTMIQNSVLLGQGLFTQGTDMALVLHCLLPVGLDLRGFEFLGHVVALPILDTSAPTKSNWVPAHKRSTHQS